MSTPTQHQQRSRNWNDIPYAALQLIDLYNSESVNNILAVRLVSKRWYDAATNYLPADAWRRFYDHLVKVHYQIPEEQIAEAKLPTPDTFRTYSLAARHWYSITADARALRETFRGVENMPRSWKMNALGTVGEWKGVWFQNGRVNWVDHCFKSLRGFIDLTKLPTGLKVLNLSGNEFRSAIDLTQLPSSLQDVYLGYNEFRGSVDLTQLPASLQKLCLEANNLTGSIDLTRLPQGLLKLDLQKNKFSALTSVNNKRCEVNVDVEAVA